MYKYTAVHIYTLINILDDMTEISINSDFIKLDSFLKWAGVVSLGSEAKMFIQDEAVLVNGEICTQRGKKLRIGDEISIDGEKFKIV